MRRALIVSLFVGSVGFWLGHQRRPPAPSPLQTEPQLVLARAVAAGVPLTEADLGIDNRTGGIPAAARPLVVGQVLTRAHAAEDAVGWADLQPPPLPVFKKGRAATVDISARSPWIHPGDHLDVLATMKDPQTNEDITVTLLQNVLVLGTITADARTQRLSLLLIPEEAEQLLMAQKVGTVDVTLRSPDDVDVLEERGRSTIYTLLSGERTRVLTQRRITATACLRGSTR